MSRRTVLLIAAGLFIGIFAWDAALYMDDVPGNSITQIVVSLSKEYPVVPAGIGFFMGALFMHFFDTTNQK